MIETIAHFDPTAGREGSLVIERRQDVAPILAFNRKLYNHNDGYSPDRTWRRAASIPNVVVEQWMREGINIYTKEGWQRAKRRLNDPEWLFLRTAPGRI